MADPSQKERAALASEGKAMPSDDAGGRFPIRNRDDLLKAIRAVGRVKPATEEARAKVRRFIAKRAKELGLSNLVPDTWNADGTLKP